MTLQEINNLQIEDTEDHLKNRLFSKLDPQPEYDEQIDHQEWYDSLFTVEDLDGELILYKSELLVVETERLRKVDIETRFNTLVDMRASFHSVYPDTPNPAVFLRDLMNQSDHTDAETKMQQLELRDYELQSAPEKTKLQWSDALKQDLADNGISQEGLLEALVRKIILNDYKLADDLKEKLEEINTRNPRP